MNSTNLQLKPTGAKSAPLKLLERTRQLLPGRVRDSEPLIDDTPSRSGWSRVVGAYLVLVILPVFVYFLYASVLETPGYVSETRITVRSAPKKQVSLSDASSSMLSKVVGSFASDTDRDSYIVLNYVKSADMISDLGGRATLEGYYSKPDIDFFSRLPRGEAMEDLLKYWDSRISANVDTVSGLLTIKITAYSPEDALELANSINTLSETLINNISLRVREDALEKARLEVARSGDELGARRAEMTAFRNSNALIDPIARAKSLGEMIATLTLDKINAETTLSVLARSNATDSPSVNVLKSQLASVDQQIDRLKSQLTDPVGSASVSTQLAGYEALKLREEFATRIYVVAQDSYLRAQQELERQQLYLITVVRPTRAEQATFPKLLQSTILLTVCLTIVWAIGALILASVRDQMD